MSSDTESGRATQALAGGDLVIARTADSSSMDKTSAFDNEAIWVFQQIFETLYTVTPDGKDVPVGQKGIMVLRRPFPGLIATLWGEPGRYGKDYWGKIPGSYYVGDAAHIDEDGKPVRSALDDVTIGVTLEQLRNAKQRWAVVGGSYKVQALRAALRGGWIDVLVTDVDTATALMKNP